MYRIKLQSALFISLLVAMIVAMIGCASSTPKQTTLSFSTSGQEEESGGISVTFSPELARSALEAALGSKLDCKGELDPEVRSVLTALQRKGRSGKVTRRDDDGRLVARRRGSSLRLQLEDHGGSSIKATMPWAVAECLLGRSMTLAEALGHGKQKIELTITGEDGDSFSVQLD